MAAEPRYRATYDLIRMPITGWSPEQRSIDSNGVDLGICAVHSGLECALRVICDAAIKQAKRPSLTCHGSPAEGTRTSWIETHICTHALIMRRQRGRGFLDRLPTLKSGAASTCPEVTVRVRLLATGNESVIMQTILEILRLAGQLRPGLCLSILNEPYMRLVIEDIQIPGPDGYPTLSVTVPITWPRLEA